MLSTNNSMLFSMLSNSSDVKLWVVLPAAGSGSRMKNTVPKQYLKINGTAIIEHTINVFLGNHEVQAIMVCVPPGDQRFSETKSSKNARVLTTQGGVSRAQSVLNGLNELDAAEHDWVLVHDAARPCLSAELLNHLIDTLRYDDVGGILAIAVRDTLKQASQDKRIESTLDRSTIWQAQTPQMFRYGLLKTALVKAIDQGLDITDEASSLELSGYAPAIVEGDSRNIKVTTAEDLDLAEFLLRPKQASAKQVQ